jgi:integrase
MARPATGTMETRKLADGTRAFHLRFRAYGERESDVLHEQRGCVCGCGGGWEKREAKAELGNILSRVRAGVWKPREPEPLVAGAGQSEGEDYPYCSFSEDWLAGKISGVIGKAPIGPNTENDYRWRLGYSQDYFGEMVIAEIGRRSALGFKAHLIKQAEADRKDIEAGVDLRDQFGRRRKPLGASSIKKIINTFAAVLDEAIEEEEDAREDDGPGRTNPARTKRMQITVPKPKRTFLEMDELAALLEAAEEQEVALPDLATVSVAEGSTAEKVVRLAAAGKRPAQIAGDLGVVKSTVTYHLRRHGIALDKPYVGRRVVVEVLGRAGLRVSELCDLRIGDVRLHDPAGARLRILEAKTEAGERIVAITPDLAEVIVEHIDRLRRAGYPVGPDDYLVPNARGGRMSRQRAWKIVAEAAKLASEYLKRKGLAALPNTTPHTLRRTFISIALLANNFDVKYVMDLVGHEDSTMTMDVYAQLQQRVERKHGEEFDRLMRRAKQQLSGLPIAA